MDSENSIFQPVLDAVADKINNLVNNYSLRPEEKTIADLEECCQYAITRDLDNFIKNLDTLIWNYSLFLPIEIDLKFPDREDGWREISDAVPMTGKIYIKIIDTMPIKSKLMIVTALKYLRNNWDKITAGLKANHINLLWEILTKNKDLLDKYYPHN